MFYIKLRRRLAFEGRNMHMVASRLVRLKRVGFGYCAAPQWGGGGQSGHHRGDFMFPIFGSEIALVAFGVCSRSLGAPWRKSKATFRFFGPAMLLLNALRFVAW